MSQRRNPADGKPSGGADGVGIGAAHFPSRPSARPSAFGSQRRSPATSAITGAPATVKTSDFTMLPSGVPMLAAASSALRAVLASAITCACDPASASAACTRRTAG